MRTTTRTGAAMAAVFLLTTGCAAGATDTGSTDAGGSGVADAIKTDCADLAQESVAISQESGDVELLKVRDFSVAEDNRTGFTKPSSGESLVLACTGTGVWSDGGPASTVRLELTVDSDGDSFVSYNEVG